MNDHQPLSPCHRVLATPELLEAILLQLLTALHPIDSRSDPRSSLTRSNARTLTHLLSLRQVSPTFASTLTTSIHLQRALFLSPDPSTSRSWSCDPSGSSTLPPALQQFYASGPSSSAPLLNPILQTTFPNYHFRFWHLSLEASGNRFCALMILTRNDISHYRAITRKHKKVLDRMLLSQPPMEALEATIWEERDETKDYVGRTGSIADPVIWGKASYDERGRGAGFVTVGQLHERVAEMFERYADVAAIKLTTL